MPARPAASGRPAAARAPAAARIALAFALALGAGALLAPAPAEAALPPRDQIRTVEHGEWATFRHPWLGIAIPRLCDAKRAGGVCYYRKRNGDLLGVNPKGNFTLRKGKRIDLVLFFSGSFLPPVSQPASCDAEARGSGAVPSCHFNLLGIPLGENPGGAFELANGGSFLFRASADGETRMLSCARSDRAACRFGADGRLAPFSLAHGATHSAPVAAGPCDARLEGGTCFYDGRGTLLGANPGGDFSLADRTGFLFLAAADGEATALSCVRRDFTACGFHADGSVKPFSLPHFSWQDAPVATDPCDALQIGGRCFYDADGTLLGADPGGYFSLAAGDSFAYRGRGGEATLSCTITGGGICNFDPQGNSYTSFSIPGGRTYEAVGTRFTVSAECNPPPGAPGRCHYKFAGATWGLEVGGPFWLTGGDSFLLFHGIGERPERISCSGREDKVCFYLQDGSPQEARPKIRLRHGYAHRLDIHPTAPEVRLFCKRSDRERCVFDALGQVLPFSIPEGVRYEVSGNGFEFKVKCRARGACFYDGTGTKIGTHPAPGGDFEIADGKSLRFVAVPRGRPVQLSCDRTDGASCSFHADGRPKPFSLAKGDKRSVKRWVSPRWGAPKNNWRAACAPPGDFEWVCFYDGEGNLLGLNPGGPFALDHGKKIKLLDSAGGAGRGVRCSASPGGRCFYDGEGRLLRVSPGGPFTLDHEQKLKFRASADEATRIIRCDAVRAGGRCFYDEGGTLQGFDPGPGRFAFAPPLPTTATDGWRHFEGGNPSAYALSPGAYTLKKSHEDRGVPLLCLLFGPSFRMPTTAECHYEENGRDLGVAPGGPFPHDSAEAFPFRDSLEGGTRRLSDCRKAAWEKQKWCFYDGDGNLLGIDPRVETQFHLGWNESLLFLPAEAFFRGDFAAAKELRCDGGDFSHSTQMECVFDSEGNLRARQQDAGFFFLAHGRSEYFVPLISSRSASSLDRFPREKWTLTCDAALDTGRCYYRGFMGDNGGDADSSYELLGANPLALSEEEDATFRLSQAQGPFSFFDESLCHDKGTGRLLPCFTRGEDRGRTASPARRTLDCAADAAGARGVDCLYDRTGAFRGVAPAVGSGDDALPSGAGDDALAAGAGLGASAPGGAPAVRPEDIARAVDFFSRTMRGYDEARALARIRATAGAGGAPDMEAALSPVGAARVPTGRVLRLDSEPSGGAASLSTSVGVGLATTGHGADLPALFAGAGARLERAAADAVAFDSLGHGFAGLVEARASTGPGRALSSLFHSSGSPGARAFAAPGLPEGWRLGLSPSVGAESSAAPEPGGARRFLASPAWGMEAAARLMGGASEVSLSFAPGALDGGAPGRGGQGRGRFWASFSERGLSPSDHSTEARRRRSSAPGKTLVRLGWAGPVGADSLVRLEAARLSEDREALGGTTSGLFGTIAGARTDLLAAAGERALGGGWTLLAEARAARVSTRASGGLLARWEATRASGWTLGAHRAARAPGGGSSAWGFSASQPLRAESGALLLDVPVALEADGETLAIERRRVPLAASGRELRIEVARERSLPSGASLKGRVIRRLEAGHDAEADPETGLALEIRLPF